MPRLPLAGILDALSQVGRPFGVKEPTVRVLPEAVIGEQDRRQLRPEGGHLLAEELSNDPLPRPLATRLRIFRTRVTNPLLYPLFRQVVEPRPFGRLPLDDLGQFFAAPSR